MITLADIVANPGLLTHSMPRTSCASCKHPLDFTTGRNWTAEGVLCDDCYYEKLGALVEEAPPVPTPR